MKIKNYLLNIIKFKNKTTETYGFKFNKPVYDRKCIKIKSKTHDDKVNILFSNTEIPKEKTHYSFIVPICIDSVLKLSEENYPQVYLEQC